MVDRLLLGSSDITSYGFKSRYLYLLITLIILFSRQTISTPLSASPVLPRSWCSTLMSDSRRNEKMGPSLGIASSRVEHYTSDIGILVRFQCDAKLIFASRRPWVITITFHPAYQSYRQASRKVPLIIHSSST